MTKNLLLAFLTFSLLGCDSVSHKRQVIATDQAPAAVGPYSQAIQVDNTIYVAGQIAIDPTTNRLIEGGIEDQTHQTLENVTAVLRAAGFSLDDVVQSQVFLSDITNFAAMNGVYASYFQTEPPARATIEVGRLPLDALIEIMVTAVKASD